MQPRVVSERTLYSDDGGRYADVDRSNFDGLGHYRTEITGGNFPGDNVSTLFTNFNPTGPPASGWNLSTFTSKARTVNSYTASSFFCFDPRTGFLNRQRVLTNGSTALKSDLITTYARSVSGNTATGSPARSEST